MTFTRKLFFLIIVFLMIVVLYSNSLFAQDDKNYIVLENEEFDFKYSNMVNIEFIKFNNYGNLIKKNISYKKIDGENLKLDILLPEVKLTKKYPVVIYIHGGGFIRGDKSEIYNLKPLVDEWHQKGWAVVSINYRLLYGEKMFPDNYNDVMDAIDWIIKNKTKYNFATDKMCVIGHSAGGNLALLSGLNNDNINCIISLAGPTKLYGKDTFELRKKLMSVLNQNDFNDSIMKEASPINYLKKDSPPTMLIHGTSDKFVPFKQSKLFYEKAKEIGSECKFIRIEGGGHVLELSYMPRMPQLKERIINFMEKNIYSN